MKILLDTHIFCGRSPSIRSCLTPIARFKAGLGRLPLRVPSTQYVVKQMEKNRISMLGVHVAHLAELESLPPLHRNPFDRMLVAQARVEKMPILSADIGLRQYDVTIL